VKRTPDRHLQIFNDGHARYVRLKFKTMNSKVPPMEIIGARGNAVQSDNPDILWIADFEMAGRRGILNYKPGRGPKPNVRQMYRIFVMFFCEFMVMPSDKEAICKAARIRTQEVMGIKEGRFWHLHEMVRRVVGQELERREMHRGEGPSVKSQLKEARLI